MTLKTKRFLFNLGVVITVIVCLLFTITLFYKIIPPNSSLITMYAITIISFASMLTLQILYKKTLSGEVIFFTVFLLCLSLQSIRIIPLLIKTESFIINTFITRLALFLKFLAIFSLFGSSLFSHSIKKQKVGSWIILSILCSLTISSVINLNSLYDPNTLLSPIIFHGQELTITFIGMILILLNFIKASFDSKNKEFILLGVGSFLITLGLQFSFITLSTTWFIVTIGLLLVGSFMFIRSVHNISLWS